MERETNTTSFGSPYLLRSLTTTTILIIEFIFPEQHNEHDKVEYRGYNAF